MTAFSDFPAPADHPLHPAAEQMHAYLRAYARARSASPTRIRFDTRVGEVGPGWTVDGEPFDAVVVASGRFRKPRLPPRPRRLRAASSCTPSTTRARSRSATARTLVYGNGISGLEIASDLAPLAPVVSAFRKPRYVIQKVVDGVSSDWQWYTQFGALERRLLPRGEWGRPAARAHPARGRRSGRLRRARAGRGHPRRRPLAVPGLPRAGARRQHRVPPGDRGDRRAGRSRSPTARRETVDAIVCATGYDLDLPYLTGDVATVLGPRSRRSTSAPSTRTCPASA